MNVLSLFSGIGGIDLGLERAGMRIVGQVEIDPWCRGVLAQHWTKVPQHDDVRTCVTWWKAKERPYVHLIVAGFPCQPVSLAGTRQGVEDHRWLWPATADTLRALRPPWVLLENVPGLLQREFSEVVGTLSTLGYDAEWDCLPASAFGAPHRRDRLFVVAHADLQQRGGQGRPGRGGQIREDVPRGRHQAVADTDREPAIGFAVPRPERHPWAVEPDVGRVADGVPFRVDRLRALGNAVVPQVAEHLGRAILAAARREGGSR